MGVGGEMIGVEIGKQEKIVIRRKSWGPSVVCRHS